ncbi:MAG TPA: lysylphosphatidylglycerol synthase domain-containing protein, partial [Candidatus Limnocylindrales bacterium]
AGRPRTLTEAVGLSVLAWGVTIVAFAAGGQAIGVQLTTAEAALLASGAALVTAIPSGPGYLGTFELAAVEIGAAFAIDRDTAFALALIVHASVLLLTSVGGAVALARLGWRSAASRASAGGATNTAEDPAAREGVLGG